MQFSPSSSGFFSELTIALGFISPLPNPPVEVNLYQDNAGVPGTILETLTLNVSTAFLTNNAPTVVAASGTTFLDSSMLYWLGGTTSDAGFFAWNLNDVGDLGLEALSVTSVNGPWQTSTQALGAFEIEANPAPEPTTLALLGSGLLGLAMMRRRKLSRTAKPVSP
jgi:hypothetical protein